MSSQGLAMETSISNPVPESSVHQAAADNASQKLSSEAAGYSAQDYESAFHAGADNGGGAGGGAADNSTGRSGEVAGAEGGGHLPPMGLFDSSLSSQSHSTQHELPPGTGNGGGGGGGGAGGAHGGEMAPNESGDLAGVQPGGHLPAVGLYDSGVDTSSKQDQHDAPPGVGGSGGGAEFGGKRETSDRADQTVFNSSEALDFNSTNIYASDAQTATKDHDTETKYDQGDKNAAAASVFAQQQDKVADNFKQLFDGPEWNQLEIARSLRDSFNLKGIPQETPLINGSMDETYRNYYEKDPAELQKWGMFQAADAKFQDAQEHDGERKLAALNDTVNKTLKELNLPETRVKIGDRHDQSTCNCYNCASGEVTLTPKKFEGTPQELIDTLTHELTHHEQNYLQTSRLADKLGVGSEATESQEKQMVDDETINGPDAPLLQRFLQKRDGNSLTADQSQRADTLIGDWNDNKPLYVASKINNFLTNNTEGKLEELRYEPAEESRAFLDQLNNPGDRASAIYANQPELKSLIDQQQKAADGSIISGGPAADEELKENLLGALSSVKSRAERENPQHMDNYRNFQIEKEAHGVGKTYRLKFEPAAASGVAAGEG